MNTLAFDIETVPDVELGRRLYELEGLDDAAVAHIMTLKQRQVRNSDVLPAHQQRVVAISCVMRSSDMMPSNSAFNPVVSASVSSVRLPTPIMISAFG